MYIVTHFAHMTRPGTSLVVGAQGTMRAIFSSLQKAKNWSMRECRKQRKLADSYEVVYLPVNQVVDKSKIERCGWCKWIPPLYIAGKQVDGRAEWFTDNMIYKLEELPREPEVQLVYDLLNDDPIALDIASDITAGMIQRKSVKRSKK